LHRCALLTEAKIPVIDVKLGLNAGYVLIFGPLAAAVAAAVIWYLIPRTPVKGAWTGVDKGIVAVLFALLPVICAFLSLQFVTSSSVMVRAKCLAIL